MSGYSPSASSPESYSSLDDEVSNDSEPIPLVLPNLHRVALAGRAQRIATKVVKFTGIPLMLIDHAPINPKNRPRKLRPKETLGQRPIPVEDETDPADDPTLQLGRIDKCDHPACRRC